MEQMDRTRYFTMQFSGFGNHINSNKKNEKHGNQLKRISKGAGAMGMKERGN